jgi:hypothetical protein
VIVKWKNAEKEVRTCTTIHPGRLRAGAFHRAPKDMESTQNMTRTTKKAPLMKVLKKIVLAASAAILGSFCDGSGMVRGGHG